MKGHQAKPEKKAITVEAVETWLQETRGEAEARVVAIRPLGTEDQGLKAYGYGAPLHVTYSVRGDRHEIVLRTMSPDPFGHERRADRMAQMVSAVDTFGLMPRHVVPIEAGIIDADGQLRPIAEGEPYLVTSYATGDVYGRDLERLLHRHDAVELDVARARALATYLSELHAHRVSAQAYRRHVRDLVGSGEGIFGLCDSYPHADPVATPDRLHAIERHAVRWRWKLRDRATHRCRRIHGDFHPYNLLFRTRVAFSVLDCSRGAAGDPADDVTCLSINYLFFGLVRDGEGFEGPHRDLWDTFWHSYLSATGDTELCDVAAPYFAWRALVLASPVWYPGVEPSVRDTLLRFAERVLAGKHFSPAHVDELLQ